MLGYQRHYGSPPQNDCRPDFFLDTERDGFASAKAGRDIYRSVERVRILIPGQTVTSQLVENVNDHHRERWPQIYDAFKQGQEAPLDGTPLEVWPVLKPPQIAELKHLQIRTIEEVAGLSDLAVQHVGMGGQMLRAHARAYLDDTQREVLTTKLIAENDELRVKLSSVEQQVAALSAQMLRMAEQSQQYHAMAPPQLSYVPGQHDPVELAKLHGPEVSGTLPSALDSFANLPPPRTRAEPVVQPEAA